MIARRSSQSSETAFAIEATQSRTPMSLRVGHHKAGVGHAERAEESPLEDLTQWRVIEARDQKSEQVG